MVVSFDIDRRVGLRLDRRSQANSKATIRDLRPGGGTALYDADFFRLPR